MSDKTPAGLARIVKTQRVAHTITADDITAGAISIDVVWDSPFADGNYTSDQQVEAVAPALPGGYFIDGFTKATEKVAVTLFTGDGVEGDVVVIHAFAIHD
jgi:hypothetical protein